MHKTHTLEMSRSKLGFAMSCEETEIPRGGVGGKTKCGSINLVLDLRVQGMLRIPNLCPLHVPDSLKAVANPSFDLGTFSL